MRRASVSPWACTASMPRPSRKRAAAAIPMAPAAFGVPASRPAGKPLNVKPCSNTASTMPPPRRRGWSATAAPRRAYSAPTPIGPYILWPENAAKSAPSTCKSTGRWATLWAQSSTTSASAPRAARTMRSTGWMQPSTFDTCDTATMRVRGPMTRSISSSGMRPCRSGTIWRTFAPAIRATVSHGTRLLWCSRSDTATSSPGCSSPARP